MDVRAHIVVSGIVQGVGYRYFVMNHAKRMQLTGWVRNLPGGDVEIEVEGPRGLIEGLISELKTGNQWAVVREVRVNWKRWTGQYSDFDIRF